MPVVELLGHMVIFHLTFWRTIKLLTTVAVSFYIPTSNVEGSDFFIFSLTLSIFLFFHTSHPNRYEMASGGLDFHFLNE